MACKKIKITMQEAGIILGYYSAIHKEGVMILQTSNDLLELLELSQNDEVWESHEENLRLAMRSWMMNSCMETILNELNEIYYQEKDKVDKRKLIELRTFFEKYATRSESNQIAFFDKVKKYKKEEPVLLKAEFIIAESITNIKFLVNRVIKLIDSKL